MVGAQLFLLLMGQTLIYVLLIILLVIAFQLQIVGDSLMPTIFSNLSSILHGMAFSCIHLLVNKWWSLTLVIHATPAYLG